jgi:UDP-N-acetylmuramate dehydrogenase
MESLSAIPGTVGAAPVQNIGAYGKEVSEFIESVGVYDRQENKFRVLKNQECEFKYRDSMFKHAKGRYVILYLNFISKHGEVKIPDQKDIKNYLANKSNISKASDLWRENTHSPSLYKEGNSTQEQMYTVQDIREAVVEVRKLKMPDPSVVPNCGSFFKNAIIDRTRLEKLQEKFPEVPVYPSDGMRSGVEVNSEFVKIPVAYIIEKVGLKGYNADFAHGNFGIHKEHALIVISNGLGTVSEFKEFVKFVKQKVFDASGLNLEEEVNLI